MEKRENWRFERFFRPKMKGQKIGKNGRFGGAGWNAEQWRGADERLPSYYYNDVLWSILAIHGVDQGIDSCGSTYYIK